MRRHAFAVIGSLAFAAAGCAPTVYRHFEPAGTLSSPATLHHLHGEESGWRHFFLYGWVPSERVIDAASECGGIEHVEEIRTRQTFAQGLIQTFAGYYVNVYAPYTGQVVCAGDRR